MSNGPNVVAGALVLLGFVVLGAVAAGLFCGIAWRVALWVATPG